MPQTNVHIIDDDEGVLDSLRMFLEQQGMTVHCHLRAHDFLELADGIALPACVVSDVRMPGMSGLDLQSELTRRGSQLPFIVITGHGDVDMAVTAVKAGARDFLEKPFNEWRLLASIQAAVAGAAQQQSETWEREDLHRRRAELSERQQQVMDLAVLGRTNKEIGAQLGISHRTVEIYRARVMERMGARTLADLVRIAIGLKS